MRSSVMVALAVVVAPALAVAAPEPMFEIRDRGEAVEVIAHQLKASHTTVSPVRQRLEVPLVGLPTAARGASTDSTVLQIDLDGDNPRVLSVKLRLDRTEVHDLARFAQAIQVGDDLHLIFPRRLPAPGDAVKLPEPTIPQALASAVAAATLSTPTPAPKPTTTVAAPAPATAVPPAPPAKAVAPASPPPPTLPASSPSAPLAPPASPTAATAPAVPAAVPAPAHATATEPGGLSNTTLYGGVALATVLVGAWLAKKKKKPLQPASTIDVVAQRTLAGKVKVVWLAAGNREMLVAVAAQQIRVLGQWPRTDATRPQGTAQLPAAHALDEGGPRPVASPAVSGILKLRERASAVHAVVNPDVATDDSEADAVWAKELLAATGARR